MEGKLILDLGHGYGATGLYIRTRTYKRGWCELVGVDPFQEYHDIQKKMGIYDKLYVERGENMHFPDKIFDLSIAQHTIEHVEKEVGYKMLSELERVTNDRVIICTPNGYTESGPLDGNPDNNHLSGWEAKDFKELGYKTRIITKNVNSRLLILFAKLVFFLKGKRWDNEVLVAWKDV